ncbi:hypothetical protein Nmel_005066 [Mimus melanotis]
MEASGAETKNFLGTSVVPSLLPARQSQLGDYIVFSFRCQLPPNLVVLRGFQACITFLKVGAGCTHGGDHLANVTSLILFAVKRFKEPKAERRPWRIWFYDTSKQAIGALFIHFANVFLSDLTEEDPCSLYLINFILDATLGMLLIWLGVKVVSWIVQHKKYTYLAFGEYAAAWIGQCILYLLIMVFEKTVISLVLLIPGWTKLQQILLGYIPSPQLELVLVMFVVPFIVNAIMFWVVDSLIMRKYKQKDTLDINGSTETPRARRTEESQVLLSPDMDFDQSESDQDVSGLQGTNQKMKQPSYQRDKGGGGRSSTVILELTREGQGGEYWVTLVDLQRSFCLPHLGPILQLSCGCICASCTGLSSICFTYLPHMHVEVGDIGMYFPWLGNWVLLSPDMDFDQSESDQDVSGLQGTNQKMKQPSYQRDKGGGGRSSTVILELTREGQGGEYWVTLVDLQRSFCLPHLGPILQLSCGCICASCTGLSSICFTYLPHMHVEVGDIGMYFPWLGNWKKKGSILYYLNCDTFICTMLKRIGLQYELLWCKALMLQHQPVLRSRTD